MSETERPSLLRRIVVRIVTVIFTVVVVAGAGAAVMFGSNTLAGRADAVPPPPEAARTKVSVTPLSLEDGYALTRRFVGQIEAGATVDLSFELGGRLVDITVDEGTEVTEGQEIARLDIALLDAEATRLTSARASIEARMAFAKSQLTRTERLRDMGHVSQAVLDEAQSLYDELENAIAETDAALASVQINLDKSVIYAPFDGRVGNRRVDAGATLAAGQPIVTVIETSAPQVRVGLPLTLDADAVQTAQIDVNGTLLPAELIQMRPDIDPLTRTRTALFAVEADEMPPFGATAALVVDVPVEMAGTWVPVDALQEGSRGVWTLLVVDEGVVRKASVELLHAEATRAYVRGSFEAGAQMIDAGAHRVVPGQKVDVLVGEG